jgi:hypothetical protein
MVSGDAHSLKPLAENQAPQSDAARGMSVVDGTGAFFIAHLVSSVMYHADRDKGKYDFTRRKATGIRQIRRPRLLEIELIG